MKFKRMLVEIDAAAAAQPALEGAVEMARRSGGRIRLVDVLSPAVALHDGAAAVETLIMSRSQHLARWAARYGDVVAGADVLAGQPVEVLLDDVHRFSHDVLVRSRSRDVSGRMDRRSAVGLELCRRCPCPVWTVDAARFPRSPRIAAAIDVRAGDPGHDAVTAAVVQAALAFATMFRGTLTFIHAWQPYAELRVAMHASAADYAEYLATTRNEAVQALAALADDCHDSGIARRLDVRHGSPLHVLPSFVVSEGIDLLVLGTAGRSGLTRSVRGNTVERLLERLTCSVLAVKPTTTAIRAAPPSGLSDARSPTCTNTR